MPDLLVTNYEMRSWLRWK